MRISRSGAIHHDLYVAGPAALPVYILDGPEPALFDAGVAGLADVYVRDIRGLLEGRPPAWLFLSHSHFDHIGAAGRFKRTWPDLRVAGAAKVGEIVAKPSARETIRFLSRAAAEAAARWGVFDGPAPEFEPFAIDRPLTPGEVLPLGTGRTLEVLAAPGHTWDLLAYFMPEERILMASEAAGCQEAQGPVAPEFLVDYDAYRSSLLSFFALDAQVLCTGHHLVLTGRDAQAYLRRALADAEDFVALVENALRDTHGDPAAAMALVKAWDWDPKPLPKQPEPAYLLNLEARVKAIQRRMGGKTRPSPR